MSASRVRENRTHGSIGGRWCNGTTLRGLLVPGRCAEKCHHHGLVGTSTAGAVGPASGLPHQIRRTVSELSEDYRRRSSLSARKR